MTRRTNLRFRTRVLLLPAVAAVAFVVVLIIGQRLGAENAALLHRIRVGHVPGVELGRDQRRTLEATQRALQDAAAAEDTDGLRRADELAAEFNHEVEAARRLVTAEPAALDAVETSFHAWYPAARRASEQLIAHQDAPELALIASGAAALHERIEQSITTQRARSEVAFGEATRLQQRAQFISAAVVLLGLLLLAALARWTVRGVVQPVQLLTEVARRIADEGDLREDVPALGDDELGLLARSLQQLVQRLRTVPQLLRTSASALSGAVSSLGQLTARQSESLTAQASALTQAAVGTQELQRSATHAAQDTSRALGIVERAHELGASGQGAVEKSLRGVEGIRQEIELIVARIAALEQRAEEMSGVLETVKDFADQSDMLALNASIEAMRMGEAGRPFQVIAREMRALADRSVQGTVESRDLLVGIQTETRAASNQTAQGARRIEASMEEIRTSGARLKALSAVVEETADATRSIAAAVASQSTAISQIASVVKDLGVRSGESLDAVAGVDAARGTLETTSRDVVRIVESFRV